MSKLPWSVGDLPDDHPSKQQPKTTAEKSQKTLPAILKHKRAVVDLSGRIKQIDIRK